MIKRMAAVFLAAVFLDGTGAGLLPTEEAPEGAAGIRNYRHQLHHQGLLQSNAVHKTNPAIDEPFLIHDY